MAYEMKAAMQRNKALREQTAKLEFETQQMAASLMILKQQMRVTKSKRPNSGTFWKSDRPGGSVTAPKAPKAQTFRSMSPAPQPNTLPRPAATKPRSPPHMVPTATRQPPRQPPPAMVSTGVDAGVGDDERLPLSPAGPPVTMAVGPDEPTMAVTEMGVGERETKGLARPAASYFDQLMSAAILKKLKEE
ncbi:hypothetical protein J8273_5271 [Carpediemonas membranifera]|uniref:Uncharacterized protein n=1 Tax=Carpediemonas membranifera TaxID=201153 RepID=A0A8J6B3P7_9EUKA|nr:hypothetical protein J8273_5271 [Carpediemonas membranifera]|eukprot:KAG9392282.1 hypothetical protein J8273_5271 [Carpediemonas membranifera]